MDELVLQALEYPKVLAMLAARTGSGMGRELATALLPVDDRNEVNRRLRETEEAVHILCSEPNVPLGGIRDVRELLKRAEIGGLLEPSEILAVGGTLYASRRFKQFFVNLAEFAPMLAELVEQITVLRVLESDIDNTIADSGGVRDDASPELARLRREIRSGQQRVREKLDHTLRSAEYQKYFQDTLVTIRGDRYVIPVKQEYRHQFPGIVHDQSASGATVFIEPLAVVNLNNDLKQWMAAEKNEVERILQQLSGKIAGNAAAIRLNAAMLAQLDFAFAKGRLALDMKAYKPEVNTWGYVELKQARHPLIPAATVVPIDIHIGNSFHTLLITGPNTGGKTVALKTVGLFALMTQAGLFLPAAEGSAMPVFSGIFADIGDEQSIEQSLSTFSAHMTHLVDILSQVGANDLVLIDEIGIGTDPDEGASLAMAMLEYLTDIGARTIATTHYSELKTFAYTRSGIENASVEFDHQTLRPTYRLLIGVPGSSNAFQISKRLGLGEHIISRARQLLNKEHVKLETVLGALEEEKRDYAKRGEEIRQLEREAAELRKSLTEERANFSLKKAELLNKAKSEAAFIIRQARQEAEEIIGELKARWNAESAREQQSAITQAKRRLRDSLANFNSLEDAHDGLPAVDSAALKPGMRVWVTTLQQQGTVLSAGETEVLVQVGILKVNVAAADCRLLEGEKPEKPGKLAARRDTHLLKAQTAARQVDIRGTNVEEAEIILDKFLDDAVLAGLPEVLVIHGKGTGALRKGVRAYLKNHRCVKEISIAELNEGGDGATTVKLR